MRLITQKRKTKHYKCIRVKPKEKRFIFLPVVSFEHLDIITWSDCWNNQMSIVRHV